MKGLVIITCGLLAAAGGCAAPCPRTHASLPELISTYNTNAARVPRLWARARITATFPVNGLPVTWTSAAPNGILLLVKGEDPLGPHDFVLVGKEAGLEVFRVGSSAEQGLYYFWYALGDDAAAYVGRQELAGAAGIEEMPIDPNQLLAVLGVTDLPHELSWSPGGGRPTPFPTAAMRMNTEPGRCAYAVSYIDRQPVSGRILFRREMLFTWSDEEPVRPFRVNFLNADGLAVLTAELSDYRPVATPDATAPAPEMPTDIRIQWLDPHTHKPTSSVRLELSEMTTEPRGSRAAARFNPPAAAPIIEVDRGIRAAEGAL